MIKFFLITNLFVTEISFSEIFSYVQFATPLFSISIHQKAKRITRPCIHNILEERIKFLQKISVTDVNSVNHQE